MGVKVVLALELGLGRSFTFSKTQPLFQPSQLLYPNCNPTPQSTSPTSTSTVLQLLRCPTQSIVGVLLLKLGLIQFSVIFGDVMGMRETPFPEHFLVRTVFYQSAGEAGETLIL